MSFVFYAMKTSGALPAYDQIVEFAAIKTNAEFKKLDSLTVSSHLLPHIVVSPSELIASGIDVGTLSEAGRYSHYHMMRELRQKLLDWSPSIFMGFNSLLRDEKFLRQGLYQTLHSPYLTNSKGNTRGDLARVVQAAHVFAPDKVDIPRGPEGLAIDVVTIGCANGIPCRNACSAVDSANAMMQIGIFLDQKVPELWSAAMRFSKKASVADFIENEDCISLSEYHYGQMHSWIVTVLGIGTGNSSERYVFNLAHDPDELKRLDDAALTERIRATPKPIRVLRTNSAPVLASFADAPADAMGMGLGAAELQRRVEVLRSDRKLRTRLTAAYELSREPKPKSAHVEDQIYDQFVTAGDANLMDRFHVVDWKDRSAIVAEFADIRLKRIGRRVIHFERPDVLDSGMHAQFKQAIAHRLLGTDSDAPWLTLQKAIDQADELILSAGSDDLPRLHRLREDLVGRQNSIRAELSD